jgi:hypothetical protein
LIAGFPWVEVRVMTLLRVVNDRFPLFASPDQTRARTASTEQTEIKNGEAAPGAVPVIETEIPHCCFYCAQCATPILLPHDSLGLPFGGPLIRRIEARSIGTVCPNCNCAGVYSLFHGCQGYNTRHKFAPAPPAGRTVLLDWLRCEEHTCGFPLPFFVTLREDGAEQTLKESAAGWNWDEVTCSSGHQVKAPRWLFDAALHRVPIELPTAGKRHLR